MRALFFLAALPLCADGLSDLKAQLAQLQGQEPVKGQIDQQLWQKTQEGKEAGKELQGNFQAYLEDGPQGFRVHVPQNLLKQARKETQVSLQDPEKDSPTTRALRSANPVDLASCLNGAEGLLNDLAQVTLIEERNDSYEGQPARLLILKPEPRLNASTRKALKSLTASLKVWVGADGAPLALEESATWKGSRFFVSFEGSQKSTQRFRRVGGRLIVLHKVEETSNSGLGSSNQRKIVTTFQPA